MAMTDKKLRFVAAKRSGLENKEAAISAGYSEKTAAQAGSRLAKDPDVLAAIKRADKASKTKVAISVDQPKQKHDDPKSFLLDLMNDISQDPKLRVDAAKALLPYMYQKLGEGGKKDAAANKAKKAASGRLAPAMPPKLVAYGGKKV